MTIDADALRRSIDMPSLLLSYGVELRKQGSGYICKCLAHDDHNPSMSVYRDDEGVWKAHCHACPFSEDVIGVVKYQEGVSFVEACSRLGADEAGGTRYARIQDEPPIVKPEREFLVPPPNNMPPFDRANYRDASGGWKPLGAPVWVGCYRTPTGEPWYYEARYERIDEDGEIRKEPRCWTYGKNGEKPARWDVRFPPKPRPLYGLDELAEASQVLVCEGPRKAEAARKMLNGTNQVACIGWAGGANGVKNADWSALAGKSLILLPDADEPGIMAMHDVARHASAESIHIIDVADMPTGWDCKDAEVEGWDKQKFLAFLKNRKREYVAPEPVVKESLTPEHTPDLDVPPAAYYEAGSAEYPWTDDPANLFEDFIVPQLRPGMLPAVVEEFVMDRARIMNVDPTYGALAAIVTAAGMIDDRIRIKVKEHDEWYESARLWGCLVGEPSSMKTPMQNQITAPIASLVEKVAAEDAKIAREQEILDARYEKKWKEYKAASIESDDHSVPEPITQSRKERKRVKVKSFSVEALEETLRDCPRGVFCDLDELAGMVASLDAYRQNGSGKDRAQMLEAFNGGPYQKDLIGRGSFTIPNWSVTILGGIQPSKLQKLSVDLTGDGFLQRFFVVCSSKPCGGEIDVPPNKAAIQAWRTLVHNLYALGPCPHIEMSPDAMDIRRQAMAHVAKIIKSGMIGQGFISHVGKYGGLTARMILTYHCIEAAAGSWHPSARQVSAETAGMAMRYMMEHLLPHSMSFYADGLGQSEAQDAAKLIAGQIIAHKQVELTTSWLHKYGPGTWRKAPHQMQAESLNRLVEYGWLQPASAINSATRRPTRYLVNPNVHTMFEKHRAAELSRIDEMREIGARIRAGSLDK